MILKITGGKIITPNGVLEGQNLYCEDSVIKQITPKQLPFDRQIDASGMFVSPGFIDLHVHGAVDCDFCDGSDQSVINAANYHLKHGTTTVFPTVTSVSYDAMVNSLKAIKNVMQNGGALCNIAGAHLEGPYFSKAQCGAQNPDFITPPKPSDYNCILSEYNSVVKRWSFAPELCGTDLFLDALNSKNVVSSIAHTNALYSDVEKAYNKGCRLITHFYSCTSTITREKGFRRLGVIESGYLFDDICVEVIADGCHIPKELFKLIYKCKGVDNICLVTDAMSLTGSKREESSIGGVPCKVKNGVACLLDESAFAGSIATADRLVRFCVNDVNLSLVEAVKMITQNPARVMGLKTKGILKDGYDADIVIFDNNINIKNVIVAGKEVNVQ